MIWHLVRLVSAVEEGALGRRKELRGRGGVCQREAQPDAEQDGGDPLRQEQPLRGSEKTGVSPLGPAARMFQNPGTRNATAHGDAMMMSSHQSATISRAVCSFRGPCLRCAVDGSNSGHARRRRNHNKCWASIWAGHFLRPHLPAIESQEIVQRQQRCRQGRADNLCMWQRSRGPGEVVLHAMRRCIASAKHSGVCMQCSAAPSQGCRQPAAAMPADHGAWTCGAEHLFLQQCMYAARCAAPLKTLNPGAFVRRVRQQSVATNLGYD